MQIIIDETNYTMYEGMMAFPEGRTLWVFPSLNGSASPEWECIGRIVTDGYEGEIVYRGNSYPEDLCKFPTGKCASIEGLVLRCEWLFDRLMAEYE